MADRSDPPGIDAVAMRRAWDARAVSNPLHAIDARRRVWDVGDFYAQGPHLVRQIVDPALDLLSADPSGLRVLEIGCGMGRLFEGLSRRFSDVWGTDISWEMIRRGQSLCPVEARWLLGDGLTLKEVADGSIDHVVCFEVFEHIPNPVIIRGYFVEIHRVLRAGGTFQAQLRRASDTPKQAIVRALPRPLRVAAAAVLKRTRFLPVPGDIDTWLGCVVAPNEAMSMSGAIGFVGCKALANDFEGLAENGPHYWVLGRKPVPKDEAGRTAGVR
jgi:2-polyprenyl-3-methyl-5-hydroxy-6-metoxy-1,4-benzoquinol methylase